MMTYCPGNQQTPVLRAQLWLKELNEILQYLDKAMWKRNKETISLSHSVWMWLLPEYCDQFLAEEV